MKQSADYSSLRRDLAKALRLKDKIWDDGLKQFSEEYSIPIEELLQKIETMEDPQLILRIRRNIGDYTQNVIPRPSDVTFKREKIGTVQVEWIKAKNAVESPLVLYFHGGGYVFGGLDASWQTPARFSQVANVNILSVIYSHAPENPYPAALNDAMNVYEYIIHTKSMDPKKIILCGGSAGGGLSLALLLKLRDEQKPLPAGAILFSPWTDLTLKGESIKTCKNTDPALEEGDLRICASLYCGSPRKRKESYVSPVFGDFNGFPPLLVDVGEIEILLDDSSRLVENAKKAGIEIQYKKWKGMPHVFHNQFKHIPEPDQAFQRAAEFLKKVTR